MRDDISEVIARLARQYREAQTYIHNLARELATACDERDAARQRVRELEAQLTGCIPVEIVDFPTANRTMRSVRR
jgi:chromosome segregation ATPase